MVIRVVAVPDYLDLPDFDDVFRTILGWDGLGFIFRVHGQEFNSFRHRHPRTAYRAGVKTGVCGLPHLRGAEPDGHDRDLCRCDRTRGEAARGKDVAAL